MVQCDFCPRQCQIEEGKSGFCAIRINRGEKIETINYGHPVTASVDKIEKKPLYHFFPGENTLSIALFGCNFRCQFCQNYRITQPSALESGISSAFIKGGFGEQIAAKEIASAMIDKAVKIVSYTYSDPVVWQDYMIDCANAVYEQGGMNVMVTNGTLLEKGRENVIPIIDAFNIDLKGNSAFYKKYCEGFREPVMETIAEISVNSKKVLEVSTLLIEGIHSINEIVQMGEELMDAGVQVWHLSRFFPHYKMQKRKATSEAFLAKVSKAIDGLAIPFVYNGNSKSVARQKTYCLHCHSLLIDRKPWFSKIEINQGFEAGHCVKCGKALYGRF